MKKKFLCIILSIIVLTSFTARSNANNDFVTGEDNISNNSDYNTSIQVSAESLSVSINENDITMEEKMPTEYASEGYKYILMDDGTAEITKFTFNRSEVNIPEAIDGHIVTKIGDNAFSSKHISTITIPDTIKAIGDRAFAYNDLRTVDLPDSIEQIGTNPFTHCSKLASIHVTVSHSSLATIDGVLYSKADKRLVCFPLSLGTNNYRIPQGIKSIGDSAFASATILGKIEIPDSVETIGEWSFYQTHIQDLDVPEGIKFIGANAFSSCNSLKSVKLPETLEYLGDYSFSGCDNLHSLDIPDNTKLGANPFSSSGFSDFKINISNNHSSLEFIDDVLYDKIDRRLIFYPPKKTNTIYTVQPGTVIIDGYSFNEANNLVEVQLPSSITQIGKNAFWYCKNLATINLPEGMLLIDNRAFFNCKNLMLSEIPNTVIRIGESAFEGCESLNKLTIPRSVNEIGYRSFADIKNLTILLEEGSYAEQYCKGNNINYEYSDTPNLDWLNE